MVLTEATYKKGFDMIPNSYFPKFDVNKLPLKVSIHSGSAHVKGKARNFPYHVASLFIPRMTRDGRWIYHNSGITTYPRRSVNVCEKDARELASKYPMCEFVGNIGSLHNVEIKK